MEERGHTRQSASGHGRARRGGDVERGRAVSVRQRITSRSGAAERARKGRQGCSLANGNESPRVSSARTLSRQATSSLSFYGEDRGDNLYTHVAPHHSHLASRNPPSILGLPVAEKGKLDLLREFFLPAVFPHPKQGDNRPIEDKSFFRDVHTREEQASPSYSVREILFSAVFPQKKGPKGIMGKTSP